VAVSAVLLAAGAVQAAPALGEVQYTVTDFGILSYDSSAAAIDSAGRVVGTCKLNPGGESHAFYWDGHAMLDLGGLLGGTLSVASGISDSGAVVGYVSRDETQSGCRLQAYCWTPIQGTRELENPEGAHSWALDVNNHGTIVGRVNVGGQQHPIVWDGDGGLREIGVFAGTRGGAFGINDAGTVVGWFSTTQNGTDHAFAWTEDSGMRDLGTLDPMLHSWATDVNDSGVIVGYSRNDGSSGSNRCRAVLWLPGEQAVSRMALG